ncbi:MAG: FG-GAP-like repeat-containing protein, partial [Actinomycetota bacterium]
DGEERGVGLAGQQALPGTPVDVTLTTGTVNDPPTITSTPTTTHTTGSAWTYDAAATDPDGDTLTFVLQAGPLAPDGSPAAIISPSTGLTTWDPTDDDAGPTDFVVRVEDGRGGIDTQSFTLDVTVPNRPPEATDDVHVVEVGSVLDVPASEGVLTNDSDPEDDDLTAALVTAPQNGTAEVNADGSFTYTPAPPPMGADVIVDDVDLTRLTNPSVTASGQHPADSADRIIDGFLGTSWRVLNQSESAWVEISFPEPVTVREIQYRGSRQHAASHYDFEAGIFTLKDASNTVLWTSGEVELDAVGEVFDLDLDVEGLAGAPVADVRVVRFDATRGDSNNTSSNKWNGLGEMIVLGDGPVLELAPTLEWAWTDDDPTTPFPRVEGAAANMPVVGDLDGDGVPEVVALIRDQTFQPREPARVLVLDGADGSTVWTTPTDYRTSSPPTLADLDADGTLEVIVAGVSDRNYAEVVVLDHAGDVEARLDMFPATQLGKFSVADLHADGVPEVIVPADSQIAALELRGGGLSELWRTNDVPARHCSVENSNHVYCAPIVADIDLDGRPEIVHGGRVYGPTGTLDAVNAGVEGGFTAVGNLDGDPFAEIVQVRNGQVWILEHTTDIAVGPIDLRRPADSGPTRGGPPTIADFDGDGSPEIGIAGSTRYEVFEADLTSRWDAPTKDPSSNFTGSTVFDFLDDGSPEVVYRDEDHLWVFDGATGDVLAQVPMGSFTLMEYPVVADIDGDGQAEIVVGSDKPVTLADGRVQPTGLYTFGGPADNWVRARPIWNQHTYHVTNIEADGRIPRVEDVNWLTPGLNNFRQNAFLPLEASRLDRFSYVADDGAAGDTATVFVDVVPPENDPVFTCTPAPIAVVGFPYESRICATDPDPDDTLTYGVDDAGVQVVVPGHSNPFLSAQPDGTTASGGDVAPDQSPVWVQAITPVPGEAIRFDASGFSSHAGGASGPGPDGASSVSRGEELGIAGYTLPLNSLVGVFLGSDIPADPATPPAGLDFSTPESRNQTVIAPEVEQIFFIGDGRTDDGTPHDVIVPAGATRLYLGTSDGFGWYNNTGAFEVSVVSSVYDGPA